MGGSLEQAGGELFNRAVALKQLYARASNGDMIPLDTVVKLRETTAPQVISHFNLFRSAEVTGNPAPGKSSGQALDAMEQLARRNLPAGFDFAWAGQSLEERRAGTQTAMIFGLSLLLVYLVLSAQYESFILPFIILLGVPLAVFLIFERWFLVPLPKGPIEHLLGF